MTGTRTVGRMRRWSLLVNVALVIGAVLLGAVVWSRPEPHLARDTANAPGARALDRAGRAVDNAAPGTVGSMADIAWFIPKLDEARYDMPAGYEFGCEQNQRDPDAVRCDFADAEGDLTVAMVGDSKILQWQSAVATLGRENAWHVVSYAKSNCGLHAGLQLNHGEPYRNCEEWNATVMEKLLSDPPDVVLVSNHVNTALSSSDQSSASTGAMVDGLAEQWKRLEQAGIDVVVILDNPSPDGSVYACLQGHLEDLGACAFDRSAGIARSGQAVQRAAADRVPGVDVVDLTDAVCPANTCVPVIGNVLVYRQGSHLTDTYVRTLTGALGRQLVPLVAAGSSSTTQTG